MANNNLASIPELWSREGLMVLTENTPAAMSVNRQFSNDIANFGDVVHAHRAARRKTRRKTDDDNFTAADAILADVPVALNQWFYDSFIIKDGEMSKSLADLKRTHLEPAIHTIARGVDRAILGRVHAFLRQGSPSLRAGKLNGMTKVNSSDYILEAQEVLHTNLAPATPKTAIVHQTAQTKLQGNELFARADARGDGGATLRTGLVGRVYNTDVVMSQDVNYVYGPTADVEVQAMEAAAVAGATDLVVDDFTHTIVAGEFFVVESNGQPTYVDSTDGTDAVTLNEGLKYGAIIDDVVTVYKAAANEATERLAGYAKEMTFTHTSGKHLQVGQLLAFGTTTRHTYTIIEVTSTTATTTTVLLDRPLDVTVGSGAAAFPGPAGAMNVVLDPNAIALVTRPLAIPGNEFGVMSAVQSYEGLGLRVTMQYDSAIGGMRVNVDVLAGVAVLDENLLCALLS